MKSMRERGTSGLSASSDNMLSGDINSATKKYERINVEGFPQCNIDTSSSSSNVGLIVGLVIFFVCCTGLCCGGVFLCDPFGLGLAIYCCWRSAQQNPPPPPPSSLPSTGQAVPKSFVQNGQLYTYGQPTQTSFSQPGNVSYVLAPGPGYTQVQQQGYIMPQQSVQNLPIVYPSSNPYYAPLGQGGLQASYASVPTGNTNDGVEMTPVVATMVTTQDFQKTI